MSSATVPVKVVTAAALTTPVVFALRVFIVFREDAETVVSVIVTNSFPKPAIPPPYVVTN